MEVKHRIEYCVHGRLAKLKGLEKIPMSLDERKCLSCDSHGTITNCTNYLTLDSLVRFQKSNKLSKIKRLYDIFINWYSHNISISGLPGETDSRYKEVKDGN